MPRENVRDELAEHREGQEIFTARRVIFGCVLIVAAVGLGVWIVLGRERI